MKRLSASILFFCLVSLGVMPLKAEILNLTVKWTGPLCETSCMEQLSREFKKIPGIQSFVISAPAGQINIVWKPNASFMFKPIDNAMMMVGLTINDIRVKVKGKLRHDTRSVTLISDGDNTRFNLLNPIVPQPGQAAEFNLAARALTPPLWQRLVDGEAEKLTATIEGLLFMPERSPPLQLVVEQLNFSKPQQKTP
jgi:hypothetical protein